MNDRSDPTYAVTGGVTGIGAQVVKRLRESGARVVVLDIAEPQTEVDQYVALDLADAGSIERAVQAVPGGLDGLCNVAGIPPRPGNAARVLRINTLGTRAFTRRMLPKLKDAAAIVNVASRAGAGWRDNLAQVKALLALDEDTDPAAFCAQQGIDATRAYLLSKEAVIVWSMALAAELLARGVRVNSVSPAAVATGILDDFIAAFGERARAGIARVGRPGSAQEIAEVICFLCQPQSRWVNGIDLLMDGGLTAAMFTDTALAP